ncbi:MAG: hypothetical protein R2715_04315 [Ilumatobacteraceae bacterium]
MERPRPARTRWAALAAALLAAGGCAMSSGTGTGVAADAPVPDTAAGRPRTVLAPNELGVSTAEDLPAACGLIDRDLALSLVPSTAIPVEQLGDSTGDEPLLYRTCVIGFPTDRRGAVGLQISVPNDFGRDVVSNREQVMEPALASSIGQNGRSSMNLAIMPTGGARGATVYFQHGGYSVMVAVVGPAASLGAAEDLAQIALDRLGD